MIKIAPLLDQKIPWLCIRNNPVCKRRGAAKHLDSWRTRQEPLGVHKIRFYQTLCGPIQRFYWMARLEGCM
jgi:hypothetical protein